MKPITVLLIGLLSFVGLVMFTIYDSSRKDLTQQIAQLDTVITITPDTTVDWFSTQFLLLSITVDTIFDSTWVYPPGMACVWGNGPTERSRRQLGKRIGTSTCYSIGVTEPANISIRREDGRNETKDRLLDSTREAW